MTIDYSLISNVGNRDINEDAVAFAEKFGRKCFVLCDGLGGHGKGDLASKYVTEFIKCSFEEYGNDKDFLEKAILQCQLGLLEEQKRLNATEEMKTTVVVLIVDENVYQYAHVGDSRLYVFRNNRILERTIDHSVPQMLALAGDIKESGIRKHPDRNRLLRVLGIEWDAPKYDVSECKELRDGDSFLLCSDGFWELILERKMCKYLKRNENSESWLAEMLELVQENGKKVNMDNYSAIAITVKKER